MSQPTSTPPIELGDPSFSATEYLRDLFGRDPGAAIELLSEDITWNVPGDPAFGGGVHHGREAVLRFFGRVLALFPEGLAIEWMREWTRADGCLIEAILTGQTATGHAYRNQYVFVLEIDDGRICRIREYADTSYAESILNLDEGGSLDAQEP